MSCDAGAAEEVSELPQSPEQHHAGGRAGHRRAGFVHGQGQPAEDKHQGHLLRERRTSAWMSVLFPNGLPLFLLFPCRSATLRKSWPVLESTWKR